MTPKYGFNPFVPKEDLTTTGPTMARRREREEGIIHPFLGVRHQHDFVETKAGDKIFCRTCGEVRALERGIDVIEGRP